MSSIKESSNDYFLLSAEEASLFDLFRILFSRNFLKREFIQCREEYADELEGFQRRWTVFISILAQKLLLLMSSSMAFAGSVIETWPNLLTSNGGFMQLLLNLLKGRVVWPDKASSDFTSLVGNLDNRVELDNEIGHGDKRYNSYLSIMASKLSYENEASVEAIVRDHWKMEFLGFYNFWNDYLERPSTPAFMFCDTRNDSNSKTIVVAFRGTSPFDAYGWGTDVDISWYKLEGIGKIHRGFMRALGLQKSTGWPKHIDHLGPPFFAYYTLREKLRILLQQNEGAKFVLTGHSLGGALAILMAAVLMWHDEAFLLDKLEGVYTFGQPRVGDEQFGKYMKEKLQFFKVKYLRYVYCNDMVPRLPYDDDKSLFFKHFGSCHYFSSCYKEQVLEEEPNKNYFSLWWFIPKHLNAVWELMRGFILPCTNGQEYKETPTTKVFRIIGLIIPGLSAHCPYDYVNTTLLGSLLRRGSAHKKIL